MTDQAALSRRTQTAFIGRLIDKEASIALVEICRASMACKSALRGASHSVAWSIYTDPVDGQPDNNSECPQTAQQ